MLTLVLATLLSGCFSFLAGLIGTRGQVTFHDTTLGLRATGTLGGEGFETSDGWLTLSLKAGVHDYTVDTLFGRTHGTLTYSGSGQFRLRVPEFTGWSRHLFDHLLIDAREGVTKRWPYDATVRVWIQPAAHTGPQVARQVLREWETILNSPLGPALRFQEVYSEGAADLTIQFLNIVEIKDANGNVVDRPDGVCEVEWRRETGLIHKARAKFLNSKAGLWGLQRHEIGHCIGLQHSNNPGHVMYPYIGPNNDRITEAEANYARLLYSIGRSGPFDNRAVRSFALPGDESIQVEYLPDGVIRQTIPGRVAD